MKVDFNETNPAPATDCPADAAEALREAPETGSTSTALTQSRSNIVGDYIPQFQEVILPRLNIVQSVGLLKDQFTPGAIVYNQQAELYLPGKIDPNTGNVKVKGTPPLAMIFLGHHPVRFAEVVPGGGRGLIVNTEDEVRKAGGTLDYNEWQAKQKDGMLRFTRMVDFLVAIEKPSECSDSSMFNFACGERKFALGFWNFKSSAFNRAVKKVLFFNRMAGCLKDGGYPSYVFNVSTRAETFNGNTFFVPVILPRDKTPTDVLEWATTVLNPETAKADDSAADV